MPEQVGFGDYNFVSCLRCFLNVWRKIIFLGAEKERLKVDSGSVIYFPNITLYALIL